MYYVSNELFVDIQRKLCSILCDISVKYNYFGPYNAAEKFRNSAVLSMESL